MATFAAIMTKRTLFPLVTVFATLLLTLSACHHHDEEENTERTILVYVAADNNLSQFFESDLKQMIQGSTNLPSNDKLILFIDRNGSSPYLMKVEQGDTTTLATFSEDNATSDAETLRMAMKWAIDHYPAESYGLVLWGHADGWIPRGELVNTQAGARQGPKRAYGLDSSNGSTWMDITSMAKALASLPKLKFIFADCCAFQCIESAYELRNCTDYIIASAAEIPGEGAPYQTVIPALFSTDDHFYEAAVDAYFAQNSAGYKEPLSVVKTSGLDNLAQATYHALASFLPGLDDAGRYPDVKGLIYYFDFTQFDMNDFILRYADSNTYTEWKRAFDQAIVYKVWVPVWMANHIVMKSIYSDEFRDFEVTEERYGGLGMFIPQDVERLNTLDYYKVIRVSGFDIKDLNSQIKLTQWYKAARFNELGW